MATAQMKEIDAKFGGNWVLDRSENFAEFLQEMGVTMPDGGGKPTCQITVAGNNITIATTTSARTMSETFQLGEAFEATYPGGKTKILVTYENRNLVTVPTADNKTAKTSKGIRSIVGAEMRVEMFAGNVKSTRYFIRA